MLIFEERGKPEILGENLSEQSNESTTNLTHSWPEPGSHRWETSVITIMPSHNVAHMHGTSLLGDL